MRPLRRPLRVRRLGRYEASDAGGGGCERRRRRRRRSSRRHRLRQQPPRRAPARRRAARRPARLRMTGSPSVTIFVEGGAEGGAVFVFDFHGVDDNRRHARLRRCRAAPRASSRGTAPSSPCCPRALASSCPELRAACPTGVPASAAPFVDAARRSGGGTGRRPPPCCGGRGGSRKLRSVEATCISTERATNWSSERIACKRM